MDACSHLMDLNLVFHSTFRNFAGDMEFPIPIKYIFKI